MAAEQVITKIKLCSGLLAPKEWQTVQAALVGAADALWENGGAMIKGGGSRAEAMLKVLCMMATTGHGHEKTAAASHVQQLQDIVRAVQQWALSPKCTGRAAALAGNFLLLWGAGVPKDLLATLAHLTTAPSGNAASNEVIAELLVSLGTTDDLRAAAPYAMQWLKAAQGNTNHHTAALQHLAWACLVQLSDATPSPVQVLTEPVHESITRVVAASLGGVSFKKNSWLEADGSKCDPNGGEGNLTVLCAPGSKSYQYTDEQTLHAWVFATLPSLIHEGLAEEALTYAMRILYQLAAYIGRGEYHLSFSGGAQLALPFVEVCVVHLMDLLTTLVALLPAAFAQVEGEVMGLFFQMIAQERSPSHSHLPAPRGYVPVAGWMGDDGITRSCVSVASSRSTEAPPSSWLNTHVPHGLQLDAVGDAVSTADEGATPPEKGELQQPRQPIWKGELFVAMLEFFAATGSKAEGAAVEAFFTNPHWLQYPQTHTFAPTVFKYLIAHAGRPALKTVENDVHLQLFHLTALSPHSSWASMLKLLPAVLNRVTYLDVLHRILDLPLLSHFLSIPRLIERGAQLAQFLVELSESAGDDTPLFADLAASLLAYTFPTTANTAAPARQHAGLAEDAAYCRFWTEHKYSIERWIAEMEPWPQCKKATTCAKYIPTLLRRYLDVMSLEYARDPKMAVNIVTACLTRYHMLALPAGATQEVRGILLEEVFKCVSNAPTILQLIVDDMVACLRQKHVPHPPHRCLHLTACAASSLSQMLHHKLSPQKPTGSAAAESAAQVFAEMHCCLFDILAMMYRRCAAAPPGDVYKTSGAPLYSSAGAQVPGAAGGGMRGESRSGREGPPAVVLHDALEASYTVWDAVEAVDALSVSLCTLAVLHPPFLETARASLNAVVRAITKCVLPDVLMPPTLRLHGWLANPAMAHAAVFKPLPSSGMSPLSVVDAATVPGGFPKVGLWPLPS